ncbi:hypothetical protein RI129_008118 [Pyrocoelia pectoralis]|uniref:SCP domain-containing protein n=1 Tax=Pyrocoelia pectoralis TaxID=417401 RepID=A0AAN7ZM63_9COLE
MIVHRLQFYVTFLLICGSLANYFCDLPCGKHENTVCRREVSKECGELSFLIAIFIQPCTCSDRCGAHFRMLPLEKNSRKVILDLHNKFRNDVAKGHDIPGTSNTLPSATNMNVLTYNREIEFVAQCYANGCKEWGAHDKCRRTSKFESAGQNMFASWGTGHYNYMNDTYLISGTTAWFDEIKDMEPDVTTLVFRGKVIGHFTQLVWAKTTHLGCARTVFGNGDETGIYLYCNYGPGGNQLGGAIYKSGATGSACTKRSSEYPNLCDDHSETDHDWEPPFNIVF